MRTLSALRALILVCTFPACNWWPFGDDSSFVRVDLWRQPSIPNRGAPTVDDSSLYVTDRDGALYRLARTDGAVLWQRSENPAGFPRGLVRAGNKVVLSASELITFDANDGTVLWRLKTPEGVGELESAASPSRIFPTVYRGAGDAIALDAATGQEVWRGSMVPSNFPRSSDKVVRVFEPEVQGSDVIATFMYWSLSQFEIPNRGGVGVVSAIDGVPRWSKIFPVIKEGTSTLPSRVGVSADVVVASTYEGYVFAYDRATGDSLWTGQPLKYQSTVNNGVLSPDNRSVFIVGKTVVVGSGPGTITGFDARTGTERWVTPTENGAAGEMHFFGTDLVLIGHFNGGLTLIDCTSGKILWSLRPIGGSQRFAHVVVSGDTVFGTSAVGGVSAFRLVRK